MATCPSVHVCISLLFCGTGLPFTSTVNLTLGSSDSLCEKLKVLH